MNKGSGSGCNDGEVEGCMARLKEEEMYESLLDCTVEGCEDMKDSNRDKMTDGYPDSGDGNRIEKVIDGGHQFISGKDTNQVWPKGEDIKDDGYGLVYNEGKGPCERCRPGGRCARCIHTARCCRCGRIHSEYTITAWLYNFEEFDCRILFPDLRPDAFVQSDVDNAVNFSTEDSLYVPNSVEDECVKDRTV